MGVRVNRIEKEFILKRILEKGTLVRILSEKKEIQGKIVRFNDDFLIIDYLQNDISHLKIHNEVSIFFVFENNQHTFTTKITEIKEDQLIIAQPEKAYKSLQRQYERTKSTEDIQVSFQLKGKRIQFDFPKTENYYPLTEPEFLNNFDPASIQDLIKIFQSKMKRIVSVSKIIILRNKVPATYEEKILAKTGKIIWIPFINDGFLHKNEYPGISFLTYQKLIDYEIESGTSRSEIGSKLEKILKEKLEKGIYSQLYCPIFYHEYLVGYIYVCNFQARKEEISIDILNYVYEFSKILCYSLKTHHYFKPKKTEDLSFSLSLLDISGSGLLFAHPEKNLSIQLPIHTNLTITLKIGKRKMEIKSLVIRKYKDKKTNYYALKFMKITPEDFRFLYEFLYGKSYSIESAVF
ncbi:MAG: PilZ domain-containing protein [Spirochaetales bacterium]|nr:PilZ domain-containing protein [Spirochaetales bacterium]